MEKETVIGTILTASIGMILIASLVIPTIDYAGNAEVTDDDIYVFMITGQSNSAYRGADLTVTNNEVTRIPYNTAYYLGTEERPPSSNPTGWEDEIENWELYSMINKDGSWHIGNYEAQLASSFYETTGKKCVIVNAGWDSASINASQPGEYENVYFKAMFNRAVSLIPSNYDVHLGCIFWAQGEADDDMTVDEYKTKFLAMWNDYKTLGWESILIAQTRLDQSPISPTAQEELDGIDNIHLATTITQTFSVGNNLLNSDNQHYSQMGRIVVAKEWMNFYLENEYSGTSMQNYGKDIIAIGSIIPILFILSLILAFAVKLSLGKDD